MANREFILTCNNETGYNCITSRKFQIYVPDWSMRDIFEPFQTASCSTTPAGEHAPHFLPTPIFETDSASPNMVCVDQECDVPRREKGNESAGPQAWAPGPAAPRACPQSGEVMPSIRREASRSLEPSSRARSRSRSPLN